MPRLWPIITIGSAAWAASIFCATSASVSVNAMLAKESVKQRIERDDVGISFTDSPMPCCKATILPIERAADAANRRLGPMGRDRWGIDATRRLISKACSASRCRSLTKSDGTQIRQNRRRRVVWLNARETCRLISLPISGLKVADADVYKFLKYFTFLGVEEIDAYLRRPTRRAAPSPKRNAFWPKKSTRLIHGEAALEAAQRISASLFAEDQSNLTETDFEQLALDGLPALKCRAN